ncbi:MAG TPA: hypothetical protein VI199_06810, partial [Novosphingobium sp.]
MFHRPAIIWGVDVVEGRATPWLDEDGTAPLAPASEGRFRWLHLSLADAVTLDWIARSPALPDGLKELLLSTERHQRAVVDADYIGCVLHDVEREFDRIDA